VEGARAHLVHTSRTSRAHLCKAHLQKRRRGDFIRHEIGIRSEASACTIAHSHLIAAARAARVAVGGRPVGRRPPPHPPGPRQAPRPDPALSLRFTRSDGRKATRSPTRDLGLHAPPRRTLELAIRKDYTKIRRYFLDRYVNSHIKRKRSALSF